MDLNQLTQQLYQEGVEKGKNEADQLINQAQTKANQIVEDAKQQAAQIIENAKQQAENLDKNTRSELQLYARQAVSAIKTEITNLLTDQLANNAVKAATFDAKFMQQLITDLATKMAENTPVVIETADAEKLKTYIAANAKQLLDKNIEIKEVKNIKTNFVIVAQNGGYKLSFTDEELIAYFKEYLRPQLVDMLF